MRPGLALLVCLASTLPAPAASLSLGNGHGAIDAVRDIDAVGLGHRFCEARLLEDMSRIDGHVTPRLVALLASVEPEDVPWQSVPDRPTGCEITVVNGVADTAGVLLAVHYTAGAGTWTDTLSLIRTPDSWLITNVFYDGGGNLRFRLLEAR